MTIRQARQKIGLSQTEFAEKLGVNQSAVSQWESGAKLPKLEHIMAIQKLTGASPTEMYKEILKQKGGAK